MKYHKIDGQLFTKMVLVGAEKLNKHVKIIDALNVFPVPDGDTGTNMNLSFVSGIKELKKRNNNHVGQNSEALAKGLLMGARGNSGVILSQLFRGFSKHIISFEEIDTAQFAAALKSGVDSAYNAVMKPVEGTILTVAREMANEAIKVSHKEKDITLLMEAIVKRGKISLANTPELLPILKEVGVVDAGGKGLLYVYEGFLAALKDEDIEMDSDLFCDDIDTDIGILDSFQSKISNEDIEFGYCTEFFVQLNDLPFDESVFKNKLIEFGDSLVVISDDDIVKVHVHSNEPGAVLNYAMEHGSLHKIKIDNMREQHSHILIDEANEIELAKSKQVKKSTKAMKPYGIIAVGMGEGIVDIFKSLGVDIVIAGGQTMNPSTEDMVNAINEINAEKYIILPNNSNIILAAEQTVDLVDKPVLIIPSKTIPQGISALLFFNQNASLNENKDNMTNALESVKTGQVTYSIRDTKFEELEISEGDFIGLADGKILTTNADVLETAYNLLEKMLEDEDEILTIFYGEDVKEKQVKDLEERIAKQFPNIEIEIHNGKQPLYYFIFGIE